MFKFFTKIIIFFIFISCLPQKKRPELVLNKNQFQQVEDINASNGALSHDREAYNNVLKERYCVSEDVQFITITGSGRMVEDKIVTDPFEGNVSYARKFSSLFKKNDDEESTDEQADVLSEIVEGDLKFYREPKFNHQTQTYDHPNPPPVFSVIFLTQNNRAFRIKLKEEGKNQLFNVHNNTVEIFLEESKFKISEIKDIRLEKNFIELSVDKLNAGSEYQVKQKNVRIVEEFGLSLNGIEIYHNDKLKILFGQADRSIPMSYTFHISKNSELFSNYLEGRDICQ